MEIKKTSSYSIFKKLDSNRTITKSKVERLASAIKSFDLTREKPIIVNEKMQVIDGQHRLEACIMLGLPIYYIVSDTNGRTNEAIILLNAHQSPWQLIDYIRNFASQGYESYVTLLDCIETNKISTSLAIPFVSNNTSHSSREVKAGTFKVGKIHWSVFYNAFRDFKEIFEFADTVMFIRAMVVLVKNKQYSHDEMFEKFRINRYEMSQCATTEQYMKMFEKILNTRRRGNKIKLT
jgi:hypothetical protein